MRAARSLCAGAACLSLISCDLIREPLAITLTEDRPFVRSVLLAGDSTARVLLSIVPAWSDPFNPFGEPNWIPIRDADVRLIAGADTIHLASQAGAPANPCLAGAVQDGSPAAVLLPGCYVGAVSGGIRPGTTYRLIADLPGHGRVEGQTLVPAPVSVVQPAAGADVVVWMNDPGPPPLTVEWSAESAAAAVELNVRALDERCSAFITTGTFGEVREVALSGASSAELLIRMYCVSGMEQDIPGYLMLTAFDSAFARYQNATRSNHGMAEASAGFTGPAIGVFGSAALVRHPVRLVGT